MSAIDLIWRAISVLYLECPNLSCCRCPCNCSIQLSQDLNLSSTIYGLGSGAFFLAYALGQLPSNFLLLRFGGPAWLSAITVVWGMAASVSESCCLFSLSHNWLTSR